MDKTELNFWLQKKSNDIKAENNIQPLLIEKKIETQTILSNKEPWYLSFLDINESEQSLKINLSKFNSREELIDFFDKLFKESYIENIDYKLFQDIIYDFDEIKNKDSLVKLWKNIVKLKISRKLEYDKFILNIYKEVWKVECVFNRVYVSDWKWWEKIFDYRADEFLAYIFVKWVKYWYDFSQISRWVAVNYHKAIIASKKEPLKWNDAYLELQKTPVNLFPEPKEVKSNWDKWHIKRYKNFPQINHNDNWWLILVKRKATTWKHWMNIDWVVLKWIQWHDRHINDILCWEWLYYEEDESYTYYKASKSGFINIDEDHYTDLVIKKDVKYPRKISISDNFNHYWDIWKDTWIIEIEEWDLIIQHWNINKEHWIIANWVRVERWEIDGFIFSRRWNIKTFWSVYGWKLTAINWNIHIEQNATMLSEIEALNWEIYIKKAEFSTIIWDKVKIDNAIWCLIIANELELWSSNANNIIVKKKIICREKVQSYIANIKWLSTNTRNTNIILMSKKEIAWDSKMIQKIKKAIEYYKWVEKANPEIMKLIDELENRSKKYEENDIDSIEELKDSIEIKLLVWDNSPYINFFVWDWFDWLNLKESSTLSESMKKDYFKIIKDLFDSHLNLNSILLSKININDNIDWKWVLDLNYSRLRLILQEEFVDKTKNLTVREYNWIDRRDSFRLNLLDEDEFIEMKIKPNSTKFDHINIEVSLDWINWVKWLIKNISCWWIAIYLKKLELWENLELYNKWTIIDPVEFTNNNGEKIRLKAIIRQRLPLHEDVMDGKKNDDVITLWCEFIDIQAWEIIKINKWLQDKINSFVLAQQRLLYKRD